MRSRRALPLVLGFSAALVAPLLARRLDPRDWIGVLRENRNPAPVPALPRTLQEFQAFPAAFEAWHADTFGLRERLLALHNLGEILLWRRAPHSRLLLGRGGWIFFTEDHSREIWRGLYPPPAEFASDWCSAVRSRASWFEAQGIAYLYAVAPNKESVYPDYLPQGEQSLGPTPLELLLREAAQDPRLPLLDLRAALAAERAHDRPELGDFVYHPHGTHWTERGGWAAAQAIVARLAELQPRLAGLAPSARNACELVAHEGVEDTWAQNLGIERWLCQPLFSMRPRVSAVELCAPGEESIQTHDCRYEQDAPARPTILLVHDSFGPWLRRPLAEHASKLVTLWQGELGPDQVRTEAPDVVVEIYTERRLNLSPEWLESGIQPISRERFEGCVPLELEQGGSSALAGIQSYLGTEFERRADGAVLIRTRRAQDKLLLPAWKKPPRATLALHLVLHAPQRTSLGFWYQTTRQPSYHPRRSFRAAVEPGRNELWLLLPKDTLVGRLLFLPGEPWGEYVLEVLEARAAGG